MHTALDSLRALSAEIYPPLLDARGLRDALAGFSGVRVHEVGRHPSDLEAAVYFCCRESAADIDVYEDDGRLRIEFSGPISQDFRQLAEAAGATFYESAR